MQRPIMAFAILTAWTTGFSMASWAQAPAGPAFDVVSVKPNTANRAGGPPQGGRITPRPDGGFTMTNMPVASLIGRAYSAAPVDMVGLPGWAMSERYDVSATSLMPNPTPEERTAMLRAMLADRFKLAAHLEPREQLVYDLVLARSDRRLGSALVPIDADCAAQMAARQAAAEASLQSGTAPPAPPFPDLKAPPPACTVRVVGNQLEGEATMATLAGFLRVAAGRLVVDKTALAGSYRMTMTFDFAAARRGPGTEPPPDAPPSIFTALPEQLGLKLESSRAQRDTLIIDQLERPSEN